MDTLPLYSTADLLEVLRHQESIPTYWLTYFPRVITSTSQDIYFDQITDGTRELAPFVAPNVQGRVMRNRGFQTKVFRPAYVKPKHVVDPSMAIPRMAGESFGGDLSPAQRWDAIIATNMQMERTQIENRWEWMAARAIIDGAVTVEGEDYPAQFVDFNRDPSLEVIVTGTWANPLKDVEGLRRVVNELASTTITRLTFGLNAWEVFAANADVRFALDKRFAGSDSNYNRVLADGTPVEYRGTISGQNGIGTVELYTYSAKFRDPSGALQPMLNSNKIVGTGPGIQGVQCYGAIKDKRAGLQPLQMFPKMWDVEDPSVTYTMTQSAPLMVPVEPNATFTITLADVPAN